MSESTRESKSPGAHRIARIAIVVLGAIGMLIVARTALFYLGVDRLAFALSLLIAGGLGYGIVELLGRVTRVERALAEIARLPRPATLDAIEASSAPLRSVLRARLHGVRATVPTAGFASYLVGLLVMIGLLGTFLGLVETLRGTREALGASSDIDALRTALATPMLGLSRAFGISAAGVAASAMLGLAGVFARRTEVSLATAVHAYGDAALGPLTVAERQLAVLESLVRHSAESTAAAARATAAIEATATALRADVTKGVAGVAKAVEGTLTPALERAVARASDVTRERLDDWSRVVEREADERRERETALADVTRERLEAWTRVIERDAEERRAREAALVEERRARDAALADATRERLEDWTRVIEREAEARHAREAALVEERRARDVALADATRERLDDWTRVIEREADERRERDAALARERHALDLALAEERRAQDAALASAWTDAAGASAERVGREGARVLGELRGALGESLSSLDGRLGTSIDALAAQLGARTTSITEDLETRLATLTTTVGAMVHGLSGELDGTRARLDRTFEATTQALEAYAERSLAREQAREEAMNARATDLAAAEAHALTRLERHVEAVDAALATHLERMTAMQHDASRETVQRALALEAVFREHAAGLTTQTSTVLTDAVRTADAAAAAAERVVVATRGEIDAREASERAQAARAEAVLSGLAAATEEITLRTGRVLTEQTERQAELEDRWLAAHDASAARLVALLTQHADGLSEGLSSTRALVDDAAGLLGASGVEMGAVAEVFTAAVDRYRDASAASLQALTGLDDAVDRAGKKAAIELLTDYLDQTREVFEHSLEVQRELFAELRALRGRGQATSAEEPRVRS